jgi:uncharacterized membrane protein
MPKKPAEDELDQQIIHTIEKAKPDSVQQLVGQVQALSSKSKQEILRRIQQLQREEKIYLKSHSSFWYLVTMTLTIATAIVVLFVPEDAFQLIYIRYVLGIIFIFWLPGYAFIKALFPEHLPLRTSDKCLYTMERIALSIGMSIALVPMVGLLLNYTPWGIRLTPIVLSLLALTTLFATAAIIRERQNACKR